MLALECLGWNKNMFSKHCFKSFLDLNNEYNYDVYLSEASLKITLWSGNLKILLIHIHLIFYLIYHHIRTYTVEV